MEDKRVAGLEPATSGLEDQRSTKWAILATGSPSRIWTYDQMINSHTLYPWAIEESRKKQDSNLRCSNEHVGLASQYFKPLSHFSSNKFTLKNIIIPKVSYVLATNCFVLLYTDLRFKLKRFLNCLGTAFLLKKKSVVLLANVAARQC